MGATDLNNGSIDLDTARLERSTRTNQPEFAPGQGGNDIFSSSLGNDSGLSPSTGVDNIFNTVSSVPQSNSLNLGGVFQPPQFGLGGLPQTQPQTPVKSKEDKIFDSVVAVAKTSFNGTKDIVSSLKETDAKFWAKFGSLGFLVCIFLASAGLLFMIFGVPNFGFNLLIGSLISFGVSILTLMLNAEKAREMGDTETQPDLGQEPLDFSNVSLNNDTLSSDFSLDDDDNMYDDDDDGFDLFSGVSQEPERGMDFEKALESAPEIDKGMYTRSYLYESFTKVLDTITPNYNKVKTYDEDDDTFITWEEYLRESAEVTGAKDDLPELISLEETLMTIKITCSRPRGLKYDAVALELANIYANASGIKNDKVYATSDAIGKKCIFTVFTGEKCMVSLKDMYNNVKDWMLDTRNYIPVVIGVDQSGNVIKSDFKRIESILVTGMPRKGKSWVVQLILTQMCAMLSPKELQIYICDPKDNISDFKSFVLPHVKKFVSGDDNIVTTLRRVIKEEAPRRKKIIGGAGFVNIWDYKDAYPDADMPIIYVVIDEVVTLAERMDKDTKAEFQGYLIELISQLPALGIRAFLIPHVVKNDIIAKTATDLIPCRISVCGDSAHIEACVGTKPKDFNFKLSNTGDMAVKILEISASTLFVHGGVLSDSNSRNGKIFEYLRRVWLKLEPDCTSQPVHILVPKKTDMEQLCQSFEVSEEDMLGFDDIDIL